MWLRAYFKNGLTEHLEATLRSRGRCSVLLWSGEALETSERSDSLIFSPKEPGGRRRGARRPGGEGPGCVYRDRCLQRGHVGRIGQKEEGDVEHALVYEGCIRGRSGATFLRRQH